MSGRPGVRDYPRNSPEAVARVLAVALVADGRLHPLEIDALRRIDPQRTLGLTAARFLEVVEEYCEDLLAEARDGRVRIIDRRRLDRVLAAVDDPERRLAACALMVHLLDADEHLSEAEGAVFAYVVKRWGVAPEAVEARLAA